VAPPRMMWLLLAACMDEATFQAEYDAELCAWKAACHDQPDTDACEEAAAAAYTSPAARCVFQPEEAAACVEGVRELECATDDGSVEFPEDCAAVWDCA